MSTSAETLAKNSDLWKRIWFTVLLLVVFRFGVHIPTPGVNTAAVLGYFKSSGGLFGLFNTLTGGALNQFSIFALGITPYISSSIIFQLLGSFVPYFEQKKKEGEHGRKVINQWTRMGTVILSVIQGSGIAVFLSRQAFEGQPLVLSSHVGPLPFAVMTVITLTAGTCFLMWLGEQISERGIGEGASLVIFSGIAASIPSGIFNSVALISKGELNWLFALAIVAFMILVIYVIIFLEVGQRRIPIHVSRGTRALLGSQASHLPLKINLSGVIPPIFASSLLLFPATLTQFEFANALWVQKISDSLQASGPLYNVIFVALIVFFCFFYTEIVLNPTEIAENLKKAGKFIPGIRAGKTTAEYIQKVMERINVGGAIYLSVICVLPDVIHNRFSLPFYFGGTSLLILVGVALSTTEKVQTYLLTQKYEGLLKGTRVKSRRISF